MCPGGSDEEYDEDLLKTLEVGSPKLDKRGRLGTKFSWGKELVSTVTHLAISSLSKDIFCNT